MKRQLKMGQAPRNAVSMVFIAAMMLGTGLAAADARASVTEFTNRAAWEAAIETYTTIDFTGFPDNTFITTQYQHLGVTFVDGNDNTWLLPPAFPTDGWGIDGNQSITLAFTTPQRWLAIDFPDSAHIELFSDGQSIYSSTALGMPGSAGWFGGLVSTVDFDRAVIREFTGGEIAIDNLYFGVPSPGAAVLLGMWLVPMTSRRRQRWSTAWKPSVPLLAGSLCIVGFGSDARASVTEFTNRAAWEAAIGTYTTIDFTGFPDNTFITTQYQHLGVTFVDGDDNTYLLPEAFPTDGWGIDGNQSITLAFTTPQRWLAIDFPDSAHIELFSDGQSIYSSTALGMPGSAGWFGGLVSIVGFDRVVIREFTGAPVGLDNLYFGVPTPGAAVLLGLWLTPLSARHRRA